MSIIGRIVNFAVSIETNADGSIKETSVDPVALSHVTRAELNAGVRLVNVELWWKTHVQVTVADLGGAVVAYTLGMYNKLSCNVTMMSKTNGGTVSDAEISDESLIYKFDRREYVSYVEDLAGAGDHVVVVDTIIDEVFPRTSISSYRDRVINRNDGKFYVQLASTVDISAAYGAIILISLEVL